MAESTGELNIEKIALQIKSLEQRTTSVNIHRTASVLELKHEIQSAFDVESNRQRLIFQGRVLRDDKNLTDYANLDNGKVIHLVIRPIDAPHNPLNDDPNPGHTRFGQRSGARPLPSFMRGLPMMEGYAFITLDSTLGDLASDGPSLLSTILNGFSPSRQRMTTPVSSNNNSRANSNASTPAPSNTAENNSSGNRTSNLSQRRSPFISFSHTTSPTGTTNNPFSLFNNAISERASTSVPFPSSVEVRLVRTLGSIRNVRAMLEDPTIIQDTSTPSTIHHSSAEQLAEIRSRLRQSGSTQSQQIGMVLGELADLMTDVGPRLREIASSLREENIDSNVGSGEGNTTGRRVNNMSRIVQGMSLINHFLGSILASADIETRRNNTPNTRSSTRNKANSRRNSGPSVEAGTSSSSSSNSVQSGSKRKAEKEEDESVKKSKSSKGKGKDKTD